MRPTVANSNALTAERSLLYVFSPSPNDHLYQLQMEQIQERQNLLLGHDVVVAQVFEDRQGHIGSDHLPSDGCDGLRSTTAFRRDVSVSCWWAKTTKSKWLPTPVSRLRKS